MPSILNVSADSMQMSKKPKTLCYFNATLILKKRQKQKHIQSLSLNIRNARYLSFARRSGRCGLEASLKRSIKPS